MTGHSSYIATFSGIDGAGKSTQIELAAAHLEQVGYRTTRVAFWDDVAVFPQFRTALSTKAFTQKADASQPLPLRNDKNIRTWYLTLVRSFFYAVDTFYLRRVIKRLRSLPVDFIIFDRYVYDLLVQVRSRSWLARTYIRALVALAPTPSVAFVLDASPDEAFLRKPEYPLAFMHEYRRGFLDLRAFVPELTVISPGSIESVHEQIVGHLLNSMSPSKTQKALIPNQGDPTSP
jgi:thymidylate kinase